MTFNPAMLGTMLKYQENLNDVFDPAWRTNRHRYLRAAGVECAELMDDYEHHDLRTAVVECSKLIEHYGYKWWKKQPSGNEAQLKDDMLRLLRALLTSGAGYQGCPTAHVLADLAIPLDGRVYYAASLSPLEKMDLMMGLCSAGRIDFNLFHAIWIDLGHSVESLPAAHEVLALQVPSKTHAMDIKQAMLEVVDMAHFLLSEVAREVNDPELAKARLLELWAETGSVVIFDETQYDLDAIDAFTRMDLMVGLCCVGRINFELYRRIMVDIGLSFPSLYRMYAAKNVLNLFRQHNGDKQGTYIKVWMGREDNVYLAELMETWTEEEGMDVLYARLADCYKEFALQA
jgi:hypothetical protein